MVNPFKDFKPNNETLKILGVIFNSRIGMALLIMLTMTPYLFSINESLKSLDKNSAVIAELYRIQNLAIAELKKIVHKCDPNA